MSKFTKIRNSNNTVRKTKGPHRSIHTNFYSINPKVSFHKVDNRKTTSECPTGYMDFRHKSIGITDNFVGAIPNFCIEHRARVRRNNNSNANVPPPPGQVSSLNN